MTLTTVYVWGFCFEDGKGGSLPFMPYYVGKHQESVQARIRKHHQDLRKETYTIFTQGYLKQLVGEPLPVAVSKADDPRVAYSHEKRDDGTRQGPIRELSDQNQYELRRHIDFYTNNLHVTFVPFEFDANKHGHRDNWKKLLERLEWVVKHELIGAEFVLGVQMRNPGEVRTTCFSFSASLKELGHIFKVGERDVDKNEWRSGSI